MLLARIAERTTTSYGKTQVEREQITQDLADVEPLLRAGASIEIDARLPVEAVVDQLEHLVK